MNAITRRGFLGMVVAAPFVAALKPEAAMGTVVAKFPHNYKTYALGFKITEEMLEDDMYTMSRHLATAVNNVRSGRVS